METKLKRIFADIFSLDPDEVHDHLTPDQVSEWDSMQHLNLIVSLEEAFDLSFTPDEMNEMRSSFGVIRRIVAARLG